MKKQRTNKQNAQPVQPTPAMQPMTDEQLQQIVGGQGVSPNPTMGPWSVSPNPSMGPWSDYGTLGGAPFHYANIEINYLKE